MILYNIRIGTGPNIFGPEGRINALAYKRNSEIMQEVLSNLEGDKKLYLLSAGILSNVFRSYRTSEIFRDLDQEGRIENISLQGMTTKTRTHFEFQTPLLVIDEKLVLAEATASEFPVDYEYIFTTSNVALSDTLFSAGDILKVAKKSNKIFKKIAELHNKKQSGNIDLNEYLRRASKIKEKIRGLKEAGLNRIFLNNGSVEVFHRIEMASDIGFLIKKKSSDSSCGSSFEYVHDHVQKTTNGRIGSIWELIDELDQTGVNIQLLLASYLHENLKDKIVEPETMKERLSEIANSSRTTYEIVVTGTIDTDNILRIFQYGINTEKDIQDIPFDISQISMQNVRPMAPAKPNIIASMIASGSVGGETLDIEIDKEPVSIKSVMVQEPETLELMLEDQKIRTTTLKWESKVGVFNKLRKEFDFLD